MDHFGGLDVSVKETSICIVDDTGRIVKEVKVASEPAALLKVLGNSTYRFKRIGLEAGPLSQWLFSALAEAELPVICVETRHMQAVLKAQINKTDRNDARGIAQMMRAGLYRPVHVKTLRSQKLRMLLTHRKLLQSKAIAIENDLPGTLPPAHLIVPGDRQQSAVQNCNLLAQHPPDNEQRLDQRGQIGKILDQLLDAHLELDCSNCARLEPEVAQGAAQVILNSDGFRLQQLAMGQQHPQFLAA